MKKDGLAQRVYDAHGALTRKEAEDVVNIFLDTIKGALVEGEVVKLHGFGRFEVVDREGRTGVHPVTGQPVTISARRTVVFRMSSTTWGND